MNRLNLYALIEGFDIDKMDRREYLARRHGITDPKMQDVWMQGSSGHSTRERDPGVDLWHRLLTLGRELCQDMVLSDLPGFFDTLGRRFLVLWGRVLAHYGETTPIKALSLVKEITQASLTAAQNADKALDDGDPEAGGGLPLRNITRWSTADELPRDAMTAITHPSSLRGATMQRSDRCYGILQAIEAQDSRAVALALYDSMVALFDETRRVGDFSETFFADAYLVRALLSSLHRTLVRAQ